MHELFLQLIEQLRTPTSNAIGFLELTQNPHVGELNEKQREYLRDAMTSVAAISEIIDDLQKLIALEPEKRLH